MDVKVEFQDGILLAMAAGRFSLSGALAMFRQICDAAVEMDCYRILVDCFAVDGDLSTLERYELGRTTAEYCLSKSGNFKIAIVGMLPTVNGFGAQVASNRGVLAQGFSESQEARDWLDAFGSKRAGHEDTRTGTKA